MKALALRLLLCAALCLPAALAQPTEPGAETAGTGDPWIDTRLADMERYAARYRDAFVDEIVRYHAAPRSVVEEALAGGARAGDVYFACALAQAAGRACRTVLDAHAATSQGWEALARSYEVPALAQIHRRIRGDISESYVRWARPLDPGRPSRP